MNEWAVASPVEVHVFSNFEPGGVQLRVRDLLRAREDDHRTVIVTLDGGLTDPARVLDSLPHTWVSLPKAGSIVTIARLRRLFARVRPDLVLTYDWGAIDAVCANRIATRAPLVHHEDGVGDDEQHGDRRRRRFARRRVLRWADRVIVPSRTRATTAVQDWRLDPKQLVRIPNGVDATRFAPSDDRDRSKESIGVSARTHVIGTVARLAPIKRIDRLLDAFARSNSATNAVLVVAGDGPERDRLRQHATELGVDSRVRWLGHVENPERVYGSLDVWVLSSDREEHPRALLEAMACGCAIVATAVGDIADCLPSEQAPFVVESHGPDAPAALALRIDRLLCDQYLRVSLGRANVQAARERFSLQRMLSSYRGTYADAQRRPRA